MNERPGDHPIDYRLIVENCSEAIYHFDMQGRLVYANRRGADLLGYPVGEILGKPFSEFHLEADLPKARRNFADRLGGKEGVSEYRLCRKDGRHAWISVSSMPMCDADGTCRGLIAFARNIDEQKRSETVRAQKLHLLRRIAGGAPIREVLDDLCLTLESLASRPLRCAVMVADGSQDALHCLAAPSLPESFRQKAAYSLRDSDSAGARALRSGRPVIVADALNEGCDDEVLAFRREYGYAAAWSHPILQDGPLGTLAFLPHVPGTPDERDAELIEFGVEVARLALAHERNIRALHESEQRFRDYADMSADWYWEQDAEFRFTDFSYHPGVHPSMPGFFDSNVAGKLRWELPYVNVPEGFWEAHRRLLEAGEPFSELHLQYEGKAGLRHVEISGRPVFDESGRLAGYRGVGRDITERIAGREKLERTQRWLEQAIGAANIGLWERDIDTWAFRFTANWKSLFGYAENELDNTAAAFDRLVHPDDLARIHATARAYAANPIGDYENQFRLLHKDGTWRWVLSRGAIVADPLSGGKRWLGCHADISAQIQLLDALRRNEEMLHKMVESLPVGVWLSDAKGNLLSGNAVGKAIWAGARYVGIDQFGEYKGWWLSSGKRIEPEEWAVARAIMKGESSFDEEIEIECFDGSRKVILNSAVPFIDNGEIIGALVVNQDITDRWHAEEKVRELNSTLEARVKARTIELETANQELDAFNFSVSHDLRTPLRSLDGFSKALLEDYAERLDDTGRDYLRRIGLAAQRMNDLIDAMYNLSRLSHSLMQIREVDLSGQAQTIVEELRQTQPGRQVEVVIAPGLRAEGDPGLMRIVLSNLLGNAWKYTARADPARIELGICAGDQGIPAFFVRDNGAGFDMRFADKLFRLFQRLHREEDFSGHGVGLATVQRIVRRHGGRIWAEGEKGRGAVFHFTLWENAAFRREAESDMRRHLA